MKTVNFLEAINSGKRFRPIGSESNNWWFFNKHGELRRFLIDENRDRRLELHRCDYDCEFELEEKSITITESEFDYVCDKCQLCENMQRYIKKELGF